MIFQVPPLITRMVLADARHQGGSGLTPRMIVLHATAGTDSLKWLTTDKASNVSVHSLITKVGQNCRLVLDSDIAYHVGGSAMGEVSNLNSIALGIELENMNNGSDLYPDAQVKAAAWQVVDWWARYGFLPVTPHSLIDKGDKTDPAGFPWLAFNQHIAARLATCLVPRAETADLELAVKGLQTALLETEEAAAMVRAVLAEQRQS